MNILSKIKQKIQYFFLEKFHANTSRNKAFHNLKSCKSIIIMYYIDEDKKYDFVYNTIKEFSAIGKTIHSVLLLKKGVAYEEKRLNMHVFSDKNTNWLGKPEIDILEDINDLEVDLLIDLSLSDDIALQYLIATSKAACKVGRKKQHTFLYDFMLDIKENELTESKLLESINYYLEKIKV